MTDMLHKIVPGLVPLKISSAASSDLRTPTGLPYVGLVRSGVSVSSSAHS